MDRQTRPKDTRGAVTCNGSTVPAVQDPNGRVWVAQNAYLATDGDWLIQARAYNRVVQLRKAMVNGFADPVFVSLDDLRGIVGGRVGDFEPEAVEASHAD